MTKTAAEYNALEIATLDANDRKTKAAIAEFAAAEAHHICLQETGRSDERMALAWAEAASEANAARIAYRVALRAEFAH